MTRETIPTLSGGGLFGHLADIRADLLGLQDRFNRECGALGKMRFLGADLLVVNSPELVEEMLVRKAASFQKSRMMKTALDPLMGEGLFTSDGELWRRQRKLMAPLFHPSQLDHYATTMQRAAARVAAKWQEGQTIDLARDLTRITMDVAGGTLFGIETCDEADELGAALTTALEWTAEAAASVSIGVQAITATALDGLARHLPKPLARGADAAVSALEHPWLVPTARNRALKQAISLLDRRVAKMIADRRASGSRASDLLSRLLEARDEEGGGGMSDKQLRDEIVTLFVAGHETTATALTWTFYLLARHPDVARSVRHDVDALGKKALGAADLPKLEQLTKVFKEALRLYPPVPIYERCATEPVTIGGIQVGEGDYVGVFPWALHHRDAVWPNAKAFDPERFGKEQESARSRYAWLPFGAGPRVCIGNLFALMEGPLVLATLLQHASLDVVETEVTVDPKAATLRPLGGLHARVRRVG